MEEGEASRGADLRGALCMLTSSLLCSRAPVSWYVDSALRVTFPAMRSRMPSSSKTSRSCTARCAASARSLHQRPLQASEGRSARPGVSLTILAEGAPHRCPAPQIRDSRVLLPVQPLPFPHNGQVLNCMSSGYNCCTPIHMRFQRSHITLDIPVKR